MAVSPARSAAFDILLRVAREHAFAGELLHSERLSTLSVEDRALCTELVMGTLRWQLLLDNAIGEHTGRSSEKLDIEVLLALRMGTYQLRFLQRIPAHAAVHESVELVKRARKRSAMGFANAVLRKVAQHPPQPRRESGTSAGEIAAAYSHPEWLVARWARTFGMDAAIAICHYDQQPPPTALRLPLDPKRRAAVETELLAEGIATSPGTLLSAARVVTSGNLHNIPQPLQRDIWIQDEASQLVALLVGHGKRLLDCCAAPGGKTALLAERNPEATILATELHSHRARALRERVTASNVDVRTSDVTNLESPQAYDRVLADVPCSGTGTLARNPEIRWRLRAEDLDPLQIRQISILRAAIRHLSPGGRIVYSTCSLEPEEGEDIVRTVLESERELQIVDSRAELERLKQSGELNVDAEQLCRGPFLRTIPGIHPCDGFFAAILERAISD